MVLLECVVAFVSLADNIVRILLVSRLTVRSARDVLHARGLFPRPPHGDLRSDQPLDGARQPVETLHLAEQQLVPLAQLLHVRLGYC